MDLSYIPGFIAAYSILFVAASSPGPAVAMLLGVSVTQGRAASLIASAGIATGSVLLNLLTLLGVGIILAQAAWAMMALKLIGSAYLLYLSYGAFKKAANPPELTIKEMPQSDWTRLFAMGFLMQVTNPKAIVFWLAIAAVGATSGGGPLVIAAFVIGAFVISFGCHGAWAVLLSARPFRELYTRARRWVEGALGAFFAFAAFTLATSRV